MKSKKVNMPKQPLVSAEYLRDLFDYNAETGELVYKELRGSCLPGRVAGSLHHSGYRKMFLLGRFYAVHRLVWLHVHGMYPTKYLDHINRVPTDNRIENLREATALENAQNKPIACKSKSGVRGVFWLEKTKRWFVRLTVDGKYRHFGTFIEKEEAIKARMEASRIHHPFAPTEITP
jgi:AP2 domain.